MFTFIKTWLTKKRNSAHWRGVFYSPNLPELPKMPATIAVTIAKAKPVGWLVGITALSALYRLYRVYCCARNKMLSCCYRSPTRPYCPSRKTNPNPNPNLILYCGCRRTPQYLASPRWHDWSVSADGSRLLVTLNDREGVRLLLAAWRISGGCRRGVTWLALAQTRGDTVMDNAVGCYAYGNMFYWL